jgi:hypothetical protein
MRTEGGGNYPDLSVAKHVQAWNDDVSKKVQMLNTRTQEVRWPWIIISDRRPVYIYKQWSAWNLISYFHRIECCILSFGQFSAVWILCAVVSEHSVRAIFIGGVNRKNVYTTYKNETDNVPKSRHTKFTRWGITQKKQYKKIHFKVGYAQHLLRI